MSTYEPYKKFIEARLTIIDKDAREVRFALNAMQEEFVKNATGRDVVLKARQMGFTSLFCGTFVGDFILKENSQSLILADNSDNAQAMLERVKWYLSSYEKSAHTKVPLTYNSKYELKNGAINSKFNLGSAQNEDVGRSRTLYNALLSEAAFYRNFRKILASLLQAVVTDGKVAIETTANGFQGEDGFKAFWDETVLGNTGFKPHFFAASRFYTPQFLARKRAELGPRLYSQEYPETPEEAFITSGETYLDQDAMRHYLENAKDPVAV